MTIMKTITTLIAIFFFGILSSNAQTENPQEIYIMGTMHTVPKIIKRSYKPMLKDAITYHPDAIYVESPRGTDSLSWAYLKDGWSKSYQKFYRLSDSIQSVFTPDENRFQSILKRDFNTMNNNDLDFLIKTFTYHRDHANYEFYSYIKTYGSEGSHKPTRHEDGDLTFKLALDQNIKLLKSMDDQRTNGKYHEAWSKCSKEGQYNGNNAINTKLNKKGYNSAIIPALFRGLGSHINSRKSLERLHKSSAFTYAEVKTSGCTEGEKYWNARNFRMSQNIAEQVIASGLEKNIVIVGASHVIGLEKALKTNYPNLKVVLMTD